MSEQLTKVVVDCATGQTKIVPLTPAEIAERDQMAAQAEADRVAREEAEAAKAALKASAKAKLVAGEPLTAEEAEVLVL
jgi:hypothetical protein